MSSQSIKKAKIKVKIVDREAEYQTAKLIDFIKASIDINYYTAARFRKKRSRIPEEHKRRHLYCLKH